MAKRIRPSSYLFPIGMLIEVDNSNFDPNVFYCNGKWERIKGRVIVGVDENDSAFNTTGKIGGSKFLQQHSHHLDNSLGSPVRLNYGSSGTFYKVGLNYGWNNTVNDDAYVNTNVTGTGDSENLQPYYTAYIWKLVSYS